jgi:hypothetical protein
LIPDVTEEMGKYGLIDPLTDISFGEAVGDFYSFLALNQWDTRAQSVSRYIPSMRSCIELDQIVVTRVTNVEAAEAEAMLAAALASVADRPQSSCVGFVLNNMAALMAGSGRIAEAEHLAKRFHCEV